MLRALIVDDESASRENLALILEDYCPGVEVCGQADSGSQAIAMISDLKPDVLFADIQMPGMSGIELAQHLDGIPIVFVTAYDQYALQALKASAVDYLLKPVRIAELKQAVKKLEQRDLASNHQKNGLETLHQNLNGNRGLSKVRVPWEAGFKVIDIERIVRLKADNTYTEVFLTDGKMVVSMSLGSFEEVLDSNRFFRTHYSHIIHLDHMDSFSAKDGGRAVMKDKAIVPISRRRLAAFKEAAESYFDAS